MTQQPPFDPHHPPGQSPPEQQVTVDQQLPQRSAPPPENHKRASAWRAPTLREQWRRLTNPPVIGQGPPLPPGAPQGGPGLGAPQPPEPGGIGRQVGVDQLVWQMEERRRDSRRDLGRRTKGALVWYPLPEGVGHIVLAVLLLLVGTGASFVCLLGPGLIVLFWAFMALVALLFGAPPSQVGPALMEETGPALVWAIVIVVLVMLAGLLGAVANVIVNAARPHRDAVVWPGQVLSAAIPMVLAVWWVSMLPPTILG